MLKIMIGTFLILVTSIAGANPVSGELIVSNADLLLWLVIILIFAACSGIVTKFGQPSVLGEILIGIFIAILAHYNIGFFAQLPSNQVISFLAELGAVFLLFEIGLESSLNEIKHSGKPAIITAIVGIVVPFILGYYILTPYILGSSDANLALFLGATLAATSTGISIRVFKDLQIIRNPACQVVLTASIIDDVIGLISLAVVTGIINSGSFKLSFLATTLFNVGLFFGIAYLLGKTIMPRLIDKFFSKISNEEQMFLTILICFCLGMAWFAHVIGLASIIGAFVAGLLLDEATFRGYKKPYWYRKLSTISTGLENEDDKQAIKQDILESHNHQRLENAIKPFSSIFVPIFFVYAGMQVDIIAALNWQTLYAAFWISVVAIVSKVASSVFLPKHINKWLVGFGMVPRGEIGLIFAMTGKQIGVLNNDLFAALLLMIIVTSIVTPIVLNKVGAKVKALDANA